MANDRDNVDAALAGEFVDRLKSALWIFDFDEKRVIWANQAALRAWQAETLEALQGRDLGADMSPSVAQRLNQYRDDFIARDATFSELWTLYPHGAPVTMQVVFRGVRLRDERMAMLCEANEASFIAPETLRSADSLLHTSVMISLFSATGDQLYRNPASRIAYGGASRRFDDQFADPSDLEGLKRELGDNGAARCVAMMKTGEGTRWHEITARHCKDAVTGEDSILISEIDISEIKAAEQRLHDFASVSSDWFWEMDADLRFTWFSENVEDKTGISPAWHYGKQRGEILASEGNDSDAVERHLADLAARKPFRDFRMLRQGPNGDQWLSSSGKPVFDQDGLFVGYRGNGSDITEMVEAEQKMARQRELEGALAKEREINGLQRQFVSMVSHEFRTPLAIIDGNAQRLLRRHVSMTPERAVGALQKVRHSVARLTELMESVLNASRLEEGRISYAPGPCNLAEILREICDSYAEIYPDHKIHMDIDDLPGVVIADSSLVRQVVSNLTSNAVKYSPAGTTIWVTGSEDHDEGGAVIAIRDEGVGIPKAELSQLCSRFFRASTSIGIAGTGIGLHLVQHFVAMHGGRIDVESVEGEGSTFTVRLPLEGVSEQSPCAAA
ncbi:MAG: ATP-binding protein [Geminicoccaceae bacterium]